MFVDVEIVDSHLHIWDLTKLHLAWLNDPAYGELARTFLLDEYRAAAAGYNITQAVYVEVDAPPAEQLAEAEYVAELACQPDRCIVGAVLGGKPASPDFRQHVDRARWLNHVSGFREVLFDRPPGHCTQPSFIEGVRFLGELGLSFDIEIPFEQLAEAIMLCNSCPDTQFILDHCGHPDLAAGSLSIWKDRLAAIAELDNVVVKISGLHSGVDIRSTPIDRVAAVLGHLFAVFGSDRVMFGSDWPVVTLTSSFRDWLEAVWQVVGSRSESDVRNLFHDNAVRVYRLR